jgi:hypothetical protein
MLRTLLSMTMLKEIVKKSSYLKCHAEHKLKVYERSSRSIFSKNICIIFTKNLRNVRRFCIEFDLMHSFT